MAYIGVTSTIDPRVESPEEIAQMLVAATKYIPADQLGATDGTFVIHFAISIFITIDSAFAVLLRLRVFSFLR
jgi:2-keto-3-deoxy-L-rhamnonate aldolase RhmA